MNEQSTERVVLTQKQVAVQLDVTWPATANPHEVWMAADAAVTDLYRRLRGDRG